MKGTIKILLVEDDPNLSLVLKDYLEMLDYETIVCNDGEKAVILFQEEHFDLCLLDVMLPLKDGFTVAQEIRAYDKETPIVFLTAKNQDKDRIAGFKAGCDDYITKPFSTEELSLRIEAILKRCKRLDKLNNEIQIFHIGEYVFNCNEKTLIHANETIKLTKKEANLLRLLCLYKNRLLPREYALREVWGESNYFNGRSMDVFITKLRKYLKHDPKISIINIHSNGFKLEVETD